MSTPARPPAACTRGELTALLLDDAERRGDLAERAAIRLLDSIGVIGTPEFAECVGIKASQDGTVVTAYVRWGALTCPPLDLSGTAVVQIARSLAVEYTVNLETWVPRLNTAAARAVAEAVLAASGHKGLLRAGPAGPDVPGSRYGGTR